MSERTSRSGEREPRDAAYWAQPVEALEITEMPEGAVSLNVDGRRVVGPLQGFGRMWRKTYWICLAGVGATPAGVVRVWKERFPELTAFGPGFHAPSGGLVPGAVALLGGGMAGSRWFLTGVMVLYADEESFTYITPEGHPFSGWITFSSHKESGFTVAQAQLFIRANDPLYELLMPLGLDKGEDATWQRTLRSLAEHFGARGPVQTEITCVDPKRQWSRAGNIRHNALIGAALHALAAPLRRIQQSAIGGRQSTDTADSGHRQEETSASETNRREAPMSEQTPSKPGEEERTNAEPRPEPRDAAYWARRVDRLEVSDVPEGAVSLNVSARREVGALQGFGQLWQKTYRISLAGAEVSPAEVVRVWKERFPELQPPQNRFYPSMAGVAPGEVLLINATVGGMPVYTGVRVIYADDESFTVMTPEGHPESGWNTFSAHTGDDGRTVIQIQSLARANDPIYEVGFRIVGSTEQEKIWTHVLKSLAAHFGVNEPVEVEKTCVDSRLQWSQARNLWYNAGARSAVYTLTAPLRWLRGSRRRNSGPGR